ncbi:MAG: class I SAM-dependent methyltransferase [Gemmataceae bacterium]|nr:class I SAM-dependent methyltransferase [Gemmataceae bacterium]
MLRIRTFLPAGLVMGALLLAGDTAPTLARDDGEKDGFNLIYVPTPQNAVEKMLDMAKCTRKDMVFDLGCGDGRIVCTAAKKYGAKGVGIDLNPVRIKDSLKTRKKFGLDEKVVEFREGNALTVKDLNKATVICLYMLPEFMAKLEPIVKAKLKPGARIVAHDYPFPNWKADQVVEFTGVDDQGGKRSLTLYMWTVKDEKK